jgi:hypothetical protein
MQVVKIEKIHNSLRKALTGPNRIQKDKAVAQALTNVEEIRGILTQGIGEEISKLHHLALRREEPVSDDTIEEGVALAGVLYNLAGAMGYRCLQSICASLSDLFVVMSDGGSRSNEPILVHARAAMLASPGMPPLSHETEQELLDKLKDVVSFAGSAPDRSRKAT